MKLLRVHLPMHPAKIRQVAPVDERFLAENPESVDEFMMRRIISMAFQQDIALFAIGPVELMPPVLPALEPALPGTVLCCIQAWGVPGKAVFNERPRVAGIE